MTEYYFLLSKIYLNDPFWSKIFINGQSDKFYLFVYGLVVFVSGQYKDSLYM